MKLSFRRFLETGEIPPFRFGTSRSELFRLLGRPTSWASLDEGIGAPIRGYDSSDSVTYGSLTFSFKNDHLSGLSIAADVQRDLDWSYPVEATAFPRQGTTITEVAEYMKRLEIPFEDLSESCDGSMLRTRARHVKRPRD